jgi:hypothetical protein
MTTAAVIECVTEYPILYDMTRPDYKDQKMDKVWDEICVKLRVMPLIPHGTYIFARVAWGSEQHVMLRNNTASPVSTLVPPVYRPVTAPAYRLGLRQA